MRVYDFMIIDEMWQPAQILSHVAEMTPEQRRAHIWVTATIDVAYPLSYAAFLGGLARAAFPDKAWLALPVLLCVPVDLMEGVSQIMVLSGEDAWVALKPIITPLKLILFISATFIAIAALIVLCKRKFWPKGPAAD